MPASLFHARRKTRSRVRARVPCAPLRLEIAHVVSVRAHTTGSRSMTLMPSARASTFAGLLVSSRIRAGPDQTGYELPDHRSALDRRRRRCRRRPVVALVPQGICAILLTMMLALHDRAEISTPKGDVVILSSAAQLRIAVAFPGWKMSPVMQPLWTRTTGISLFAWFARPGQTLDCGDHDPGMHEPPGSILCHETRSAGLSVPTNRAQARRT